MTTAAPQAAPESGLRYVPQLDGLRGLAVLMVFVYHAFRVPLMWAGVDLFFILSGYLITSILLRDRERFSFSQALRHFYVRRAQRILPAYIVFLACAWWLVPMHWEHTWGYYAFFLQNIPYAFGFAPATALVPLWSLAVEQHFYLLWPTLILLAPRRWLPRLMLAVLIMEPVLRALCAPLFARPEPIYSLTPFRLDALAAGALIALVLPRLVMERSGEVVGRLAKYLCISGVVLLAGLSVFPWFRRDANTPLSNALLYSLNIVALGGFLLWTLLLQKGLLLRLLSSSLMRALGRVSYMFYLMHLLILEMVASGLSPLPSTLRASHVFVPVVAFLLTSLVAALSWFLIERPVLSLSAKRRPSLLLPK